MGRPGTYMAWSSMVAVFPLLSSTNQLMVPIAVVVSRLTMPLIGIPGIDLTLQTISVRLLV